MLIAPAKAESQPCKRCKTFTRATYEHILFTCNTLTNKRNDSWRKVLSDCPGKLGYELECMSGCDKTSFILNALNNSYISEWHACFQSLATYIHDMWYWYLSDEA